MRKLSSSLCVLAFVLSACSGNTTSATNVTSTSAVLNAQAECDKSDTTKGTGCFFEFRWKVDGTSTWTNGPISGKVGAINRRVSVSQPVTGLQPSTTYDYVLCGVAGQKVPLWGSFVCVGPDGKVGSVTRFTTAAKAVPSSCFVSPGACGFPDPRYHNAGAVPACSSLRASGSITATTPGQTITGVNVNGTISVEAPNVTINNVCVTTNGGGQIGSIAINLASGASNTLIEHSTVAGANSSNASVDIAVRNVSNTNATAIGDYFYNCGECVHDNPWTINDSYVIANGMLGTSDHYEAIYCDSSTVSLNHDTLLNPEPQTAVLFCNANNGGGGACVNHVTLTNSLLAGGGIMLYTCGNASSVGTSTSNITGNRFARCTLPPIHYNPASGGTTCQGNTGYGGADLHGYFAKGGYFSVDDNDTYCPPTPGQTWTNNIWDDNHTPLTC